jgi:hypothetical protein
MAVGAALAAALAATPGVASADSPTDPFSWIGGMDLGDLSVPAQTSALDMQVSIDGFDLFPTAGNTATASSGPFDLAIAIGNGAQSSAGAPPVGTLGIFDVAFADGASSGALSQAGDFDSAIVIGANSTAEAGSNSCFFCGPENFDLAAAFGDMLHASALGGFFLVDIPPLPLF